MKILRKNLYINVIILTMILGIQRPSAGQTAIAETSVTQNPQSPISEQGIAENKAIEAAIGTTGIKIPDNEYTLGAEDIININVLRHPEVSGEFVIDKNGKMQYEFVGDIEVVGLTKDQVAKLLAEKLSRYIISPEVTVKIIGYNSKVVYVVGEVGNPGKIFMRGDTITVRDALVQAGLPLLSAKSSKSKLITPSASGDVKEIIIDIDKLLYKGDLRENLVMKPGDTLYVPATFMAKVLRVIQPVATPIGTAAGAGSTVTTGF